MKYLLTFLYNLFAALNPGYVTVLTVGVSLVAVFTWIQFEWTVLLGKIDLLSASSFAGQLPIQPMGFLDTFVPVTEALSYFTAWLAILAICTTIRIVKSFIPSIAS